jgi:UPF0176 protein
MPVCMQYVEAGAAWDALVRDEDCVLIDVRNQYEIALGSFADAANPRMETFR